MPPHCWDEIFVELMEQLFALSGEIIQPGRWLVDVFPVCRHNLNILIPPLWCMNYCYRASSCLCLPELLPYCLALTVCPATIMHCSLSRSMPASPISRPTIMHQHWVPGILASHPPATSPDREGGIVKWHHLYECGKDLIHDLDSPRIYKCKKRYMTNINDVDTEKGSSYFQCPRDCRVHQC